jgi:hypothetical protein
MNFITLNSNWKFELNKSIGKRKMTPFLWAETDRPMSKTRASSPLSPSMAHRLIPATTDDMEQGLVGEVAWTKGDRWRMV